MTRTLLFVYAAAGALDDVVVVGAVDDDRVTVTSVVTVLGPGSPPDEHALRAEVATTSAADASAARLMRQA
ncbi:hypothetical protein ACXVUM_03620 [Williamsia sp. SKLECPSW1]